MLLLLFFAFLAGIVTILSPCILPVLPIVLSGSVAGDKKRPLGIIVGFILSFTFFTLFLTKIIEFTGIPSDTLRFVAAGVLLLFGVSLLLPRFQVVMELVFTKLSVITPKSGTHTGFFGGILIGLSIGLIWSPCVGPILASVIALAATSKVTTQSFLITLSYSIGSGIPMFFIMYGGQNLLQKNPWLLQNTTKIQKIFGVLMILMSGMIFFNWDRNFEQFIATTQYGTNITKLEENSAVRKQLDLLKKTQSSNSQESSNDLFNTNTPAPDFAGVTKWLNPDKPLTMQELRSKVVLIDFWTYTCINCIRTLPYVTSWYDKYKDKGFIVIGVHTPEFEFEKKTDNVLQAIKQYKIHYPVAQDNDYATWNAYNNQYWPAEYLIDVKGTIRRTHFGEGEYDQMEMAIKKLLEEAGNKVDKKIVDIPDQTPKEQLSPETYVGSKRVEFYYPSVTLSNGTQSFELQTPATSSFSLGGTWTITDENAVSGKDAVLVYKFHAQKVFLVMRPNSVNQNATVKVYFNNKAVDNSIAGSDVKSGVITVDSDRLYNIIDLSKTKSLEGELKLEFQTPGTEVFAFTFG